TVIARKRRVAENWSDRRYAIRRPSLSAVCTDGGGVCQVKGVMDWELRNARSNTSARGATTFDYSLVLEGGSPPIAAESSSDTGKPASEPSSLQQVSKNLQQFFAKLSKLAPTPRSKQQVRPPAPIAR